MEGTDCVTNASIANSEPRFVVNRDRNDGLSLVIIISSIHRSRRMVP